MSNETVKTKDKIGDDINDVFKNLSLKDPLDIIHEKFEKLEIKTKQIDVNGPPSESNSPNDSGYEDDKIDNKQEKSDLKLTPEEENIVTTFVDHKDVEELVNDRETSNNEASSDESDTKTDQVDETNKVEKDDIKNEEVKLKKRYQDLIITGDKEDVEKEEPIEEKVELEVSVKNEKDVEDSGYIRRTGKTLMSQAQGDIRGQDALYFNVMKSLSYDDGSSCTEDSFNQYDLSSPQPFSPFLLSSDSSNMQGYASPQNNQGYYYNDNINPRPWDSPQSSPSPYCQIDASKREFKIMSRDSDNDCSFSGNSYLTPPPSVSPPKQFLDGSPCHQSCIQIVDLIDKVDQNNLAGSGPEDELKNLLSALECEQDSSLWDISQFMTGNLNDQTNVRTDGSMAVNKGIQQSSVGIDQVSNMWNDVQDTDNNELSVYLPHNLNVDEVERALVSSCDPQALFDLESRVSAVLSNNPMAIIPDDQHGDTNLIVLASRDEDKRDKIVEKIYALAKGLSNVRVCCNSPLDSYQCLVCGNSNPESFHTPLTLSNVQGYTALSCAVLRAYPSVIVKYLVALIQKNKLDLSREFCGDRNKLYLSAKDYPFLSTYATEYAPVNW